MMKITKVMVIAAIAVVAYLAELYVSWKHDYGNLSDGGWNFWTLVIVAIALILIIIEIRAKEP